MVSSVLIANRGEIAVRIARTAKRLGLRTIAVYSDADARALHVAVCDEAHRIGPPPPRDSYLRGDVIIEVARRAGADFIHPGYGFLSENPDFAAACEAADLVFVGPPAEAIRAMGLKGSAKTLMDRAGVPVVPGYHGERQEAAFLKRKAYEIGYPVLIKAEAGGGGKGMRRVDKHADFDAALAGAMREAEAAFGDARVLIEKYVEAPRHIEMQILADRHGNVIHLNERDCSLQRRHQKVIEEAPAPGMTAELRAAMGQAAVAAARAVGYVGAGTVEFIADGTHGLRADRFWFMEMNTRLQVEHPVTEAITGLDLVEWQFRVAAGEALPFTQDEVPLDGHAVEARLYAEDPASGFLPSTGPVLALELPAGEGIRVDAGVAQGGEVTPYYDPMIAKVIAHAPTRDQALDRLATALARTVVAGPRTNVAFLAALARAEEFRAGHIDTNFIDRHLDKLGATPRPLDSAAAAAGVARLLAREGERIGWREEGTESWPSPWDAADGFQLGGARHLIMPVMADNEPVEGVVSYGRGGATVAVGDVAAASDARTIDAGDAVYVLRQGRQTVVRARAADALDAGHHGGGDLVVAPMHGKVLEIAVAPGDAVRKGERVAAIEAMKMEHALVAPIAGIVGGVFVAVGDQVEEGAKLMAIEEAS